MNSERMEREKVVAIIQEALKPIRKQLGEIKGIITVPSQGVCFRVDMEGNLHPLSAEEEERYALAARDVGHESITNFELW